ncbi:adenine nucleotide alpha hydrolases-like protein [Microstroma glucosiphilum]|uniref:FAD synthase n=1 Tax=Pseudomicrostroma glucosiphilum TaxID=1684307 RepID=A0A316U1R2_9BASI|nr:adenine nucleotide alpha hydrolases-like protein [Pseudomicrostroma glucosiphilum]PWN19227.1 adenine nucleotide alpha hydrolases-like protein [Pseudomicrostroma glucosiphilum]
MAHPTSSSSASGPSSSISITSGWLDSVDAVYHLFEQPELRSRYPSLATKVKEGVQLCEEVIKELGLEHCALSFNGGKDCTVIVHMLAAVLRRLTGLTTSTEGPLVSLPSVYITCPSPFPILESFIRASQVRYNLDLVTVPGDMKDGLVEYFDGGGEAGVPPLESRREEQGQDRRREVEGRHKRGTKAIFIGTRRTDPMGDTLTPRKWTDPSWPKVERIHPILDWDYADVWEFLRCPALGHSPADASDKTMNSRQSVERNRRTTAKDEEDGYGTAGGGQEGVPYCRLYDEGFTSLGSTFNTFPNPLLQIEEGEQNVPNGHDHSSSSGSGSGSGGSTFRPAWQLKDGSSERAGRGDKSKK